MDKLLLDDNKYKVLIENFSQKIFYKDRNSVYVSCNESYANDLKIKPDEIIGKTDYNFYNKELAEKYRTDDKRIIESGKTEELEEKYIQDGQEVIVHTIKTPIKDEKGSAVGIFGIFWDITEHKRMVEELCRSHGELELRIQERTKKLEETNKALLTQITERKLSEAALRESEERYRKLVEFSPYAIAIHSEGKIVFINAAGAKLIGAVNPGQLIGKSVIDFVHPDYQEIVRERIRLMREEGKNMPSTEEKFIKLDGSVIDVEVAAMPFTYQGKTGIQVIIRDITDRKRAEEELKQSEKKYRNFLEKIQDGIFLIQGTKFQYINEGFAKMVGYTVEEVIGKDFWEFVVPEDREMVIDYYRRRHAGEDVPREYEFTGIRRDGTKHIININIGHINYNGTVASIGTVKDITERRRAEERLEKLNRCFLEFSADPIENINRLTALCGELMGATCALYNRLDRGMLCSLGKWSTPTGYNPIDKPEGHICYDVINNGEDGLIVIRNLPNTPYARTDPNVRAFKLRTYIGRAVKFENEYVGSLCVVYQNDYIPTVEDRRLIEVIASAIGVEENRKAAREALSQSEEKYRSLIENIQDGVFIAQDARIQFANEALARIGGCTAEEVIGKDFKDLIAPEDLKLVEERHFQRLAGENIPREYEVNVLHKDGKTRRTVNLNMGLLNYKGRVATIGTVKDITERKRAEEKLRLFRSLIDQSNDAIFVDDPETGRILDVNDKTCNSLGYRREELLGMHVSDIETTLSDHISWKEHIEEIKKKGCLILEGRQRRKDGTILPVEVNISYISFGENNYTLTIARDISERKRMENALRESEDRYKTIFETTGTVMAVIEEDNKISLVNEEIEKLTGYSREEVEGKKSWTEFIVKEDLERMIKYHCERRVDPKLAPNKYEFRLIDKKGSIRDIFVTIAMIPGTKKSIASLIDITEYKRSEEQIQEQAALLDKAQDAIGVIDLEHRLIYWNKGSERLYGWTAEEAIGKNADELLYKDDSHILIEVKKRVIEEGEWIGELRHITKNGKEIIVESRWTLIRDSESKPKSILVINTDVTEKKKLESQLLLSQRMESVGTLAGGIAHDINNVLTPIMLSQQLLQERLTDEESQRLLNTIERSTQRGANLMKQVQSFAKGAKGERNVLQMAHIISEIKEIAKETFPKSIEIRTDIPKDIWTISGDATQLHQVIMNLCVNARDAMPDGGILNISAGNLLIDKDYAHISIEAKIGPYIVITISDTGIGIPAKILDRIFEPFFTTKEHGKGTGLGLSISHGIVKSHGGFINVYSEIGKGTTFKVYLPAITTTEALKAQGHKHKLPAGHGESILVVDDEDQILKITKKTLEKHGYKVITASDGKKAIALYSKHREKIKVVLMDMMMPVMDGSTSIQELHKINPELKIIAVSGLTETDKLTRVIDAHEYTFLTKPYTAERLLKTIHEVLSVVLSAK